MNILSVSYPLAPVSEDSVGGAEQVLAMLDRALVEQGHHSFVIAPAGSRTRGTLIPVPEVPETIGEAAVARAHEAVRKAISQALLDHPIDLIHLHGIDFPYYLPPPGPPVLATLHLPISWYPPEILHLARPRTWLHCVSASQHASAPASPLLLPPIPNGVDTDFFRPSSHPRDFALFLGRICPEKGVTIAIGACRDARVPLLIGGMVYPYEAHQRYFEEEIRPRLGPCCRFLGPLNSRRKQRLISAARFLVAPSLAPETSSLVAMEALACGTPVIGMRSGALPEIVRHGLTGYLVDDESEMSAAMKNAKTLRREECRREALNRFPAHRTAEAYLRRYRGLSSTF